MGRRARKLAIVGAGAVIALLGLLLCLPLWFPWILRPVARHLGATYSRYEREGYSRFKVYGVRFVDGSTHVTAERLEAPVPTVWLWKLTLGKDKPPLVSVDGWGYQTLPATNTAAAARVPGTEPSRNYAGVLQNLAQWIPSLVLSNGTIRVPGVTLDLPQTTWSRGSLNAAIKYAGGEGGIPQFEASVAAQPAGPDAYRAQFSVPSLHLAAGGQVSTTAAGVQLRTTNSWWGNRVEVQAEFAPGQDLPEVAQLSAPAVRLPPEAIGLRYYGDLVGSVSATWRTNRFGVDLHAQAQPLPVSTNFPPLNLTLHAGGDTNSAIIEKATLVSPWLTAQLSRGLEINFKGKLLRERAFLDLAGDLGRQPWFPLKGRVSGEAQFTPSWGKLPAIDFRVSGSDLGYQKIQSQALLVQGRLEWPQVEVSSLEATLADGTAVQAAGKLDVKAQTLQASRFGLHGPWLKQWLPAGFDFTDMTATGTAEGPFSDLHHEVDLSITNFSVPYLKRLDVQARWQGLATTLTNVQVVATAGHSSALLRGGFEGSASNLQARLFAFELRTNNQLVLTLLRPAEVQYAREKAVSQWKLETSSLTFTGEAGQIEAETRLVWPEQGAFGLHLRGISLSLADDFVETNLPPLAVNRLDAEGSWSNGPVQFSLGADAIVPQLDRKGPPVSSRVVFESTGNAQGLVVSNLLVTSRNSAVLSASASLPLAINPAAGTNLIEVRTNAQLRVHATTTTNAFFWDQITKATGIALVGPQFAADLGGTWKAPNGKIRLRADRIELLKHTNAMPKLSNLELEVDADPHQARLSAGQVLVQGQRVSLYAELPLGPSFWASLRKRQPPDWTQGRARLRIEDAELAAFEPLFPKLLAPQGELSVDLALWPGGRLEGQAHIEHARTRPLGDMGPIRDIGINLRWHEHSLSLDGASARIGGATVTISGRTALLGTNWNAGELPPFELAIHGASVPLARTPEFVLRTDLLLSVTKTNGAPPLISGAANLRDSFFLTDLQNLIPGVATPANRPPYFSIREPFLADWRLAVDVQGNKFLNVRSPLFNGVVSSNAKLLGTLQDPIAIGDVRIDSGAVRFPFASIPVKQGVVTLSSQNPYHPQLLVMGASKQFGYDIRMEVTGPVDAPIIQFNSTPPLSSEQILLMVTAGEMPQGNFNLSSQQRAQTVAVFLGRDVLSSLGIGDQTDQRLTVRTGEEISDQGRPTYNVEYKLTDRWSITGEYDRFGDYNAGFKWRIFSK